MSLIKASAQISLFLWAFSLSAYEQPVEDYAQELCVVFDTMGMGSYGRADCNQYVSRMNFKKLNTQEKVLKNMCRAAVKEIFMGLSFPNVKECQEWVESLMAVRED